MNPISGGGVPPARPLGVANVSWRPIALYKRLLSENVVIISVVIIVVFDRLNANDQSVTVISV